MIRNTIHHLFIIGVSVLLLAGCSPSGTYDALKKQAPEAGGFSDSLAAEYLAYAESQAELGYTPDADYFAAKGLQALKEESVEPETVSAFIGQPLKAQLEEARTMLMALLTDNIRRVLPQQAARAQLLYDCWYHQRSQLKIDEDAPCEAEFGAAIEELENASEVFTHRQKRRYLFYFSGMETALNESIQHDLHEVATLVSGLSHYQIELHAMPFGEGATYNDIAGKRVALLREALIAQGIKPERVEIHDDSTAKTVYLSHDRKEQPKNTVALRIKTMGLIGTPNQ